MRTALLRRTYGVALVTGSSRGIGKAIAIRANLAKDEDVEALAHRSLEAFGQVDILVNNAGVSLPCGQALWQIEARRWDLTMAINVKAPFLLTRLLLPSMISRRRGGIVNISSLSADTDWSVAPGPAGERQRTNPAHCVTKAALERLTVSAAVHVKEHNIAVNALKPSAPTYSEGVGLRLRESDSSAWRSPYAYMTKAALFLARQDAGGVTGGVFLDEELCRRYQLT